MRLLIASIAVSLALPFAACQKDGDEIEAPPATKPVIDRDTKAELSDPSHLDDVDRAPGSETADLEAEAERQDFIDDAEQRLEALDSRLEKMAQTTGEEMTAAGRTARDELREVRNKLADELQQARSGAGDGWEAAKSRIKSSLNDLERGYNELLDKAKTEE